MAPEWAIRRFRRLQIPRSLSGTRFASPLNRYAGAEYRRSAERRPREPAESLAQPRCALQGQLSHITGPRTSGQSVALHRSGSRANENSILLGSPIREFDPRKQTLNPIDPIARARRASSRCATPRAALRAAAAQESESWRTSLWPWPAPMCQRERRAWRPIRIERRHRADAEECA